MQYSISKIAEMCGAILKPGTSEQSSNSRRMVVSDTVIRYLLTDSRKLSFASESLFIALNGPRYDGHDYIAELYAAGVRNFMVSKIPASEMANANFVCVSNTLHAFQQLAATHRSYYNCPVIGITGSNGKTMVKEWLFQLLNPDFNITRSPRSYNSQIGVPLSVCLMDEHTDLALIEAGISMPGEMEKLEKVIKPTIGILTNIGTAHNEGFANRNQKLTEKLKLFKTAEIFIYHADSHQLDQEIKAAFPDAGPEMVRWSFTDQKAPLYIRNTRDQGEGLLILYCWKGHHAECRIPFRDAASLENAIHCLAVMLHLGIAFTTISDRMHKLHSVAMRMELQRGQNNCLIINDAYSADLASLRIALDFLSSRQKRSRDTIILSDILQSGLTDQVLYEQVASLLAEYHTDRLFAIGKHISAHRHQFEKKIAHTSFFESTEQFLRECNPGNFSDERILVKGARSFQFEKISRMLQFQAHGTVLEISLDALVHNLNVYKKLIGDNVRIMVMVKAFAYGAGYIQVARALAFNRVDYLAVAYTDEGVALRKSGIEIPIMVMSPQPDTFENIFSYDLEPEIHSLELLDEFLHSLDGQNHLNAEIPIHLKLDTGMHRLGFSMQDFEQLTNKLQTHVFNGNVRIASIFSHLAAAEDVLEDDFSREQIRQFEELSSRICARLILNCDPNGDLHQKKQTLRHILNSSGIVRFPDSRFDMVRLGIGLYGLDPAEKIQQYLQQPARLRTHIAQIRDLPGGETIGYNRKGKKDSPMRVATLNIGYADGLRRSLGNGRGKLSLNGQLVPIVGNVCMDLCMVDVSEITDLCTGDEVEIFGNHISLNEFAKSMDTIPYEALTGISPRVKRVYLQE